MARSQRRRALISRLEALEPRAVLSAISGSDAVTFVKPVLSGSSLFSPGSDVTGTNTPSFAWGRPASAGAAVNRISFTPADFTTATGDATGAPSFTLGRLTFVNGSTQTGTGADDVDAKVALNLVSAVGPNLSPPSFSLSFDLTLALVNTANRSGAGDANDDTVSLPMGLGPVATFDYGGATVDVDVVGLRDPATGGVTQSLVAPEGGSAAADLMVRFVVRPSAYVTQASFGTAGGAPGVTAWVDADGDGRAEVDDPQFYQAGSTMTVAPTLSVPHVPGVNSVLVRATGPDGLDFPATTATRVSGHLFQTGPTDLAAAFAPDTMGAYTPLTLQWQVSADEGATWSDAGATHVPVYVGLGSANDPETAEIAAVAANGLSNRQDIINAVWAVFAGLDVRAPGGGRETYFVPDQVDAQGRPYYDGGAGMVCGNWANFFGECLSFAGVQSYSTDPTHPASLADAPDDWYASGIGAPDGYDGFLDGNWTFKGSPKGGVYYVVQGGFDPYATYSGNPMSAASVSPLSTARPAGAMAAQDNADPPRTWGSHFAVILDGEVYDPCYGIKADSLDDYRDMVMPGFYKVEHNVVVGGVFQPTVYAVTKNPGYTGMSAARGDAGVPDANASA